MRNIVLEPGEKVRVQIKNTRNEYEIQSSAKKGTAQMTKAQDAKNSKQS